MHRCSIEFTGPPGSGKTRLEAEISMQWSEYTDLTEVVSRSGHRIEDRIVGPVLRRLPIRAGWAESLVARSNDRHELLIEFLMNHPGTMAALERLIDVQRGTQSTALALRWFFAHSYRWQLAQHVRPEAHLLMAEGFAHRSLSFIDPTQPVPKGLLASYLEVVPRPCLLVLLEVDEVETTRRLRNDGRYFRHRVAALTEEQQMAFYSGMHRSASALAQVAEDLGWEVARVENRNVAVASESVLRTHRSIGCSAI